MIQFEWFFYGLITGLAAPYVWPIVIRCIEEARIARKEWKKDREYD